MKEQVKSARQELIWCDADEAEKWPEGITVLQRRETDEDTRYEVDHWFRPDWVASKIRVSGKWSWARLE